MKLAIVFVPFLWISLTAQVQFSPAQRFPVPPQDQGQIVGKASIEGSVLDAITHEPVKKASVTLMSQLGLSAVTDASGHFAFRQLPAGRYGLQARSDKYPAMPDPFDTGQQVSVTLAADEQKQDVTVLLTPGASVRGRIVDEEGNPMSGCNVSTMQFRDTGMGRLLQQQSGNSQSNEKGEYRIASVQHGKYYIQARCFKTIPLPHAFIRRASPPDVPMLTYAPVFYPGSADPAGAAKVEASPGADIAGIDFRMAPARGVTVHGRIGPAPDREVQIMLTPKDSAGRDGQGRGAPVNQSTGEFQIRNVLPGSYELVAFSLVEGHSYFARVAVEVGEAPSDAVDLTLAPAPTVSGSISFEGDTKTPMNGLHIMLSPLDGRPMLGRQADAAVQSDGTFTINSVMPGHWRLIVNGAPGYVKSARQGDQEITPWDFEIGSSPVQLKVVVSTKFAQIEASLAAAQPAGSASISGVLWAAGGDPQVQQNFQVNQQGPGRISVPPGKYYACAFAVAQPWMLMQNHALRKALESHCETVEASEEGTSRVQVPFIPAADLKQLFEKIEE